MDRSVYAFLAGHGRSRLLGKDDSCEKLWPCTCIIYHSLHFLNYDDSMLACVQMKGLPEFPADQQGAGDVLSHLTASLNIGEQ